MRYWLGADFGQASDFTAVAVLERVPIEVGEREVVRKTGLLRREKVRVPTHDHQLHLRACLVKVRVGVMFYASVHEKDVCHRSFR